MPNDITHLKGATTVPITTDLFGGFKVQVTDKSSWINNLSQLIPLFGKVVFEEFENEKYNPDDSSQPARVLHQLEISFKDIDYMFILYDKETFVGLIAMKVLTEKPRVGILIELILNPKYRGQKISPKLYDLVFKSRDLHAITSYSRHPAAANARYKIGNLYGYETVFGDMPTRNPEVANLQNTAKEYFINEGIVADFPAPKGYIFLKGEENVNTPLQEKDVQFSADNPLYKPFKRILEIQKTNIKDTAVGLLVSIRN